MPHTNARLDIIYNYGGIYFDTDVEALKPFDELLKYPAFCGFESEHFINFGHGFAAEKGNKIIKQLMLPYENMDFKISDNILKQAARYSTVQPEKWQQENCLPSPILQTQFLVGKYGLKQNNTRQSLDGMEILPSLYFAPKNDVNLPIKTDTAYSVHWFAASWLPWYERAYLKAKKIFQKLLGKNYNYLYNLKKKYFK